MINNSPYKHKTKLKTYDLRKDFEAITNVLNTPNLIAYVTVEISSELDFKKLENIENIENKEEK